MTHQHCTSLYISTALHAVFDALHMKLQCPTTTCLYPYYSITYVGYQVRGYYPGNKPESLLNQCPEIP